MFASTSIWLGLGFVYTVFITLFAFDEPIFSLGFLIHCIPTIILLFTLTIGLIRPKVAGIIFTLLFVASIVFFQTYRSIQSFCLISLPILATGSGLFFAQNGKNQPPRR